MVIAQEVELLRRQLEELNARMEEIRQQSAGAAMNAAVTGLTDPVRLTGLRICPTGAKWSWNHCSHKLVNADKCLVNVSEKIPSSTHHRSVRTSTTLTVIWIEVPCLFTLNVTKTAHTQQFCDYLSLFQEGEQGGSGHHVLSNLHFRGMEGKERSNPLLSSRDQRRTQTHWEETQAGAFQRCGEYSPMQRDYLE